MYSHFNQQIQPNFESNMVIGDYGSFVPSDYYQSAQNHFGDQPLHPNSNFMPQYFGASTYCNQQQNTAVDMTGSNGDGTFVPTEYHVVHPTDPSQVACYRSTSPYVPMINYVEPWDHSKFVDLFPPVRRHTPMETTSTTLSSIQMGIAENVDVAADDVESLFNDMRPETAVNDPTDLPIVPNQTEFQEDVKTGSQQEAEVVVNSHGHVPNRRLNGGKINGRQRRRRREQAALTNGNLQQQENMLTIMAPMVGNVVAPATATILLDDIRSEMAVIVPTDQPEAQPVAQNQDGTQEAEGTPDQEVVMESRQTAEVVVNDHGHVPNRRLNGGKINGRQRTRRREQRVLIGNVGDEVRCNKDLPESSPTVPIKPMPNSTPRLRLVYEKPKVVATRSARQKGADSHLPTIDELEEPTTQSEAVIDDIDHTFVAIHVPKEQAEMAVVEPESNPVPTVVDDANLPIAVTLSEYTGVTIVEPDSDPAPIVEAMSQKASTSDLANVENGGVPAENPRSRSKVATLIKTVGNWFKNLFSCCFTLRNEERAS